jgi:hypothetical protein
MPSYRKRSGGGLTAQPLWQHAGMLRWPEFAVAVPELAAFGAERLLRPPAYLATVTADGGARVHPVTPVVSPNGLYVFMEPSSPKGHDLRERHRFAIHNGVPDTHGSGGEFFLSGEGTAVEDAAIRAQVVASASYQPAERYVLFELLVGAARANGYGDVTLPDPARWSGDHDQ